MVFALSGGTDGWRRRSFRDELRESSQVEESLRLLRVEKISILWTPLTPSGKAARRRLRRRWAGKIRGFSFHIERFVQTTDFRALPESCFSRSLDHHVVERIACDEPRDVFESSKRQIAIILAKFPKRI